MGPPHLGQRGTNSVGTWPLCSAADNFFCHLQTRIDGVVAGAGTLEHKKSEPFSYREKVQIFYFNGSPPGRHSYGLGTAH